MKKSLLACLLGAALLSGCMSTSENAATVDRKAAAAELIGQMDEVGYAKVNHVPAVDQLLHTSSSILERQRNVISMYQTQSDTYRDVQAFLYANKDLEPQALEQAILTFDAGANSDEEKIGHKITAYQVASEDIYSENMELALELGVQLGQAALVLAQYPTEVAQATALSLADGWIGGSDDDTEENNLGIALVTAKDRLELAYEANELIDMELDTIKAVEALQLELEAKR